MLSYRVKRNDTLNGIAASHRVTQAALIAANPALAAGATTAAPGSVLQIPCEPKASAEATKPMAVGWATRAVKFLEDYAADPSFGSEVVVQTHWHLDKDLRSKPANLRQIIGNYKAILRALQNSGRNFREVDNDTAKRESGFDLSTSLLGAYTFAGLNMSFTSHYPSLGPNARTAVMVHEAAHFISRAIGHVGGEWGPDYWASSPATAIHNAHVYANFAASVSPTSPPAVVTDPFGLSRPDV